MLIIFTGNGKGKTTAALGQAMRALGRGKRVLMIQFIKGPWISGEDEFCKKFKIQKFKIVKMGLGFVGILGDKLPRRKHREAAEKALACFKKELKSKKWNMIMLDEINAAVSLGLLKTKDVLASLKNLSSKIIIILTGRQAPKKFIEKADLVTEMKEIKHPFKKGKLAERGLEF